MENTLKPFVVDIEERYHRQVVVWAEDVNDAENKTNDLCSENVIPVVDADDSFHGRDVDVTSITEENKHLLKYLDHFGKEDVCE